MRKKKRVEEQIATIKQDQKALHEREVETVKIRFEQKLEIERQRIAQLNNQILEESGDIDQQVKLFSQNLLSNKIQDEKVKLESDYQMQLQQIREQQRDELQKAKDRLEADLRLRLNCDRDRERNRLTSDNHELDDAKEEA